MLIGLPQCGQLSRNFDVSNSSATSTFNEDASFSSVSNEGFFKLWLSAEAETPILSAKSAKVIPLSLQISFTLNEVITKFILCCKGSKI